MDFRKFDSKRDEPTVKAICYGCDSASMKHSFQFLRTSMWQSGARYISELLDDVGFYAATRCKNHMRLTAIAVKAGNQGSGIGRILLERLKQRARQFGLDTITFRTSQTEDALRWWLNRGADIGGVKGDDFEMTLKI